MRHFLQFRFAFCLSLGALCFAGCTPSRGHHAPFYAPATVSDLPFQPARRRSWNRFFERRPFYPINPARVRLTPPARFAPRRFSFTMPRRFTARRR